MHKPPFGQNLKKRCVGRDPNDNFFTVLSHWNEMPKS